MLAYRFKKQGIPILCAKSVVFKEDQVLLFLIEYCTTIDKEGHVGE